MVYPMPLLVSVLMLGGALMVANGHGKEQHHLVIRMDC